LFHWFRRWLLPNEENRRAWVCEKLRALPAGLKLLDAGAGQQPYKPYCQHLEYAAQDFGRYTPQGGEGLQVTDWDYGRMDFTGDVWSIPAADRSFDVVLCTEVLEHVPYPNETLREFARLLRPGGRLLLTAPYACLPHMRPHFYYSGFSREYFTAQLGRYGFEVRECRANGNFFLYLAQEILRGLKVVPGPLGKVLYALVFGLPVLCLRGLAALVKDEQLVFGWHVEAVKKPDQP
jgi:SAM-dependent methyltransferase